MTVEQIRSAERRCTAEHHYSSVAMFCCIEDGHAGPHFEQAFGVFWLSPPEAMLVAQTMRRLTPEVFSKEPA